MAAHIDDEALRSSLQHLRRASIEGDPAAVMKRAVDAVHDVFGYSGQGPCYESYVYAHEVTSSDLHSDIRALRAYSDLTAEILGAALAAHQQGTLARQLQYALDYRVVIERAVGYLMGAHQLDAVTAFTSYPDSSRIAPLPAEPG